MLSPPLLVDSFGRTVRYLRLSVTDRCDFRCTYCMAETMQFVPRSQLLSLEELAQVGEAFIGLGVDKIRLTGGEPLVRHNIRYLIERLARQPGLRDLAMTTNGNQLASCAADLKQAGLQRVNISLDSLDAARFREITRTGDIQRVMAGLDAALHAGLVVKLNTVALKGINDSEIPTLVQFACDRGIDITFIEEMPLGILESRDRAQAFLPSNAIQAALSQHFELIPSTHHSGGPARYWCLAGYSTRVGFISPHSHNFCGDCNRVRLTAEGRLLLCLGQEQSLDLRAILREHPQDTDYLRRRIQEAMALKPEKHHFNLNEPPQILRFMNTTGG